MEQLGFGPGLVGSGASHGVHPSHDQQGTLKSESESTKRLLPLHSGWVLVSDSESVLVHASDFDITVRSESPCSSCQWYSESLRLAASDLKSRDLPLASYLAAQFGTVMGRGRPGRAREPSPGQQ